MDDVAKASSLRVELDNASEPAVIRVVGEIDITTGPTFARRVDELVAARRDAVVFDFEGVEFIDSSGLAVLVNVARAGRRVVIRNASDVARRTIEVTGLTEVISLEP